MCSAHSLFLCGVRSADVYGFVRSAEYLKDEHIFMTTNMTALSQRDHDWITYLKSIGGCSNLKPFGQYKPSAKLRLMARRGIPAAFRPLLWKHISMSTHFESKFPSDYYSTLLARLKTQLCATVQLDISKDVGRTFPDHEILNSEKGKQNIEQHLLQYIYIYRYTYYRNESCCSLMNFLLFGQVKLRSVLCSLHWLCITLRLDTVRV
jgi:hypothetical protein